MLKLHVTGIFSVVWFLWKYTKNI